jgi:hypothetical protein
VYPVLDFGVDTVPEGWLLHHMVKVYFSPCMKFSTLHYTSDVAHKKDLNSDVMQESDLRDKHGQL